MILAIDIAGIPIAFPRWVEIASYLLLALAGLGIAVSIWRTIVISKQNTLLGEIHAKTSLLVLIIKGWQEKSELDAAYEKMANEHYAPDNLSSTASGSTRAELSEVTDEHERLR
jgi:hypothetical protein